MTDTFDPGERLVVVRAELFGPSEHTVVRLGVDTGATVTLVGVTPLELIGHEPSSSSSQTWITTGSGEEVVPRVSVDRIKVLGHERSNFPVLAHTLPLSTQVDGLLGLDYMRAHVLHIDFHRSAISLT